MIQPEDTHKSNWTLASRIVYYRRLACVLYVIGYIISLVAILSFPTGIASGYYSYTNKTRSTLINCGRVLNKYKTETGSFPPERSYFGSFQYIVDQPLNGLISPMMLPDFAHLNKRGLVFRVIMLSYSCLLLIALAVPLTLMIQWSTISLLIAGSVVVVEIASVVLLQNSNTIIHSYLISLPLLIAGVGLWIEILRRETRSQQSTLINIGTSISCILIMLAISKGAIGISGQTLMINPTSESRFNEILYVTDGKTDWVLQSAGPDNDYDWHLQNMISFERSDSYDSVHQEMRRSEYSPTNGLTSDGDILFSSYQMDHGSGFPDSGEME